jgi:NAD dependent epimerase/dehydratase
VKSLSSKYELLSITAILITNKMPRKILVTGADGFIGSHLVEDLVRRGSNVRAFVQYNALGRCGWLDHCDPETAGHFEIFSGDIRDPNGVLEAMSGCTAVAHLAALIGIPYSYHSPDTYIDTNVRGTLNILQAARKLSVAKVVHTSTSEVYGTAQFVPITETHPLQGQSPYSASKIAADQLAYSFFASFDTPVIILRPFNTYGPRQSARAVIPTIISQMLSGARELHLGSLTPTRDFSYVSDTVRGFVCALDADSGYGEVINLGSGFEVSIGQTVDLISQIMGTEVSVSLEAERVRPRRSEVERLLADNTKARALLGWSPRHSGLPGFEDGLKRTIEWFQGAKNIISPDANRYFI